MIEQPIRLRQGTPISQRTVPRTAGLSQSSTTWAERFFLMAAIIILPLQDHIPAVAGVSVMFLIFGVLIVYVLVNRPLALNRIWYHPVFIAAYIFIGCSVLLEWSSPLSRYDEIFRFGQMIVGAICVAALCRDRSALAAGLYGFIVAGLWVSMMLYTTSYGTLQEMGAEDFSEGSKARNQAFANKPVQANINGLGFVCAQGAIVAFALAISDRWKHRRIPLLGIAAFCLIASFLPMSRGTAALNLVSFAAIFYTHGIKHGKALIFACVLALGIYMLVPNAVWSRMVFSTEVNHGQMESRAYLYTTAFNHLSEYIVAGIGLGNYYNKWGYDKGFTRGRADHVVGVHNVPLALTIYWGFFGLLTFLLIIGCVYRAVPLHCNRDELSVALVAILVSLSTLLLQSHTFFDKPFALGLGMLVGARYWIWPAGIVSEIGKDTVSRDV